MLMGSKRKGKKSKIGKFEGFIPILFIIINVSILGFSDPTHLYQKGIDVIVSLYIAHVVLTILAVGSSVLLMKKYGRTPIPWIGLLSSVSIFLFESIGFLVLYNL